MADAPDLFTLATLPRPENDEKLYAVIGDPVKHSLSPQMHNAAFKALGLNSRYVKVHVAPAEFEEGIAMLKSHGFSGWNVTVPHKTAMFDWIEIRQLPAGFAARSAEMLAKGHTEWGLTAPRDPAFARWADRTGSGHPLRVVEQPPKNEGSLWRIRFDSAPAALAWLRDRLAPAPLASLVEKMKSRGQTETVLTVSHGTPLEAWLQGTPAPDAASPFRFSPYTPDPETTHWTVTVTSPTELPAFLEETHLLGSAHYAQAVNTVFFKDGELSGASTDAMGWASAVHNQFAAPQGATRVVFIGAGGSAQSLAVHACRRRYAKVTVLNRTPEKARAIADLVARLRAENPSGTPWTPCDVAETPEEKARALAEADLLVNTTSLGLKPDDAAPVDLPDDLSGKIAYDLIYNPAETAFLRAAKAAGARTANGLSMLLWQGFLAFQHWHPDLSGDAAGRAFEAMRRALEEAAGQELPPPKSGE